MINLYSTSSKVISKVSEIVDVEVIDDIRTEPTSDTVILNINSMDPRFLFYVIDNFRGHNIVYIVDRKISYRLFSFFDVQHASYILDDEVSDQIKNCVDVAELGGVFIGEYFSKLLQLKSSTYFFTNRDIHILELIMNGHTNTEISEIVGLHIGTVGNYVSKILEETGFGNRLQLALYFQKIFTSEYKL